MPVKIYIGRDIQDHTQLPASSHETQGIREICKNLWETLHYRSSRHYAVVVNPKRTTTGRELNADLLLISQLGLGVMELKHYYGNINCRDPYDYWYADYKRMYAGAQDSQGRGPKNPHQQVQRYAAQIRHDLIHSQGGWLSIELRDKWQKFKFHTSVCFTNPDAQLNERARTDNYRPGGALRKWEKFSVLTPAGVPPWATELRFEVDHGFVHGHRSFSWTVDNVIFLAENFFGAREWNEMTGLMPIIEPYAYLSLIEDGRPTRLFGLYQNNIVIGRDPTTCNVLIPQRYESVSRNHASLTRSAEGIFIKDTSTYGTYVEGLRVKKKYLKDGQRIVLCPPTAADKMCVLEFSLYPTKSSLPSPPTTLPP